MLHLQINQIYLKYHCELGYNKNEEMKIIYQLYSYKDYGYRNSYNKLKISKNDCIHITINKNNKTNQYWFNFIKRDIDIFGLMPMKTYLNFNPNCININNNNKGSDRLDSEFEFEFGGVTLLTNNEICKCGLIID